ncbi:hypothetical protein ACZ75_05310 [Massilia sp. NR 4-1]|nr:hypothetical protein ACZ75_05310 [Massilia sp. NR 4-1]
MPLAFICFVLCYAARNRCDIVIESMASPILHFDKVACAARMPEHIRVQFQSDSQIRVSSSCFLKALQEVVVELITVRQALPKEPMRKKQQIPLCVMKNTGLHSPHSAHKLTIVNESIFIDKPLPRIKQFRILLGRDSCTMHNSSLHL